MKQWPAGITGIFFLLAGTAALALNTSGNVKVSGTYSFAEKDLDYGIVLEFSSTIGLSDHYFGNIELFLKYQDENNIRPFRAKEISLQGVQAPWEETDFRIGLLEMTWGASDIMSPVDVLNPRPFSLSLSEDALQDKIPVPALDLEWYLSSTWSLEFFYQPQFVANFIPKFVEERLLLPLLLPFGADPEKTDIIVTKEEPLVSFSSPIWALRARGTVSSSLDVALSYTQGYFLSSYPRETDVVFLPDGSWKVDVLSGYPKRSILGLEFQGTLAGIEGLTFRGDVAWIVPEKWVNLVTLPQGESIPVLILDAPYWKASLGVDYSFNDTYVSLAYLLGNLWEEGETVSPYTYLHADWKSRNGTWNPFLNFVASLEDGSTVWILGTEYKPRDNWNVSLAFTTSGGAPGSKLGDVSEGVLLEVKYSF